MNYYPRMSYLMLAFDALHPATQLAIACGLVASAFGILALAVLVLSRHQAHLEDRE